MNAHDWARGKTGRTSPARAQRGCSGTEADASAGLIQRKESCACGGSCPSCQAKADDLAVSRAGDASEVEADRVADRVVRGESVAGNVGSGGGRGGIARAADGAPGASAGSSTTAAIRSSRGSGKALDAKTQSTMSQRFGQDLTGVRVHSDSRAAALSEQLNARAFTVGNDVYFGRGRFDPASSEGQRLLAHELTHVVQQGHSPMLIQRDVEDEFLDSGTLTPAIDEDEDDNTAEPMDDRKKCKATDKKSWLLKNYDDFDFTIPQGCKAKLVFEAIWVPGDTIECCTGADTYEVKKQGKRPKANSLPIAANICGREEDPVAKKGSFSVGSRYHKFRISVNRNGCDIRADIKLTIEIS